MNYPRLLVLVLCSSCIAGPVKIIDSSKNCDEQSSSSKIITSSAISASVTTNCDDLSQYKCEVREFSPSMTSDIRKGVEHCPEESSECLRYDHHIFDTSEQKQIDEYASAEDFERGGQYNRQEVRCWNPIKKSRAPASDSSSLKDALKAAYDICKQ